MLARDGVVLLEAQLLGLRARILLRHVEEAGIGAADELDLVGCRLCHRRGPKCLKNKKRPSAARCAEPLMRGAAFVKFVPTGLRPLRRFSRRSPDAKWRRH